MEKISITTPGCRERFEMWIRDRGGIQVWKNINLSDWRAGDSFAPVKDADGNLNTGQWSRRAGDIITDLTRFRFAVGEEVLARVKVAVRRGRQGLMYKATDASMRRIQAAEDKAIAKYGADNIRTCKDGGLFDPDRSMIIARILWEDEKEGA
jgi:hypothetical protein